LREEIQHRLSANYMYNPQVDIFVREYRSRQVAVIGAVTKPGLYRLASEADTLLDMLSQAGGLTPKASQRIHFIPAEPVERGKALKLASTLPMQLTSQSPSPLLLKRSDPLILDLQTLSKGTNQLYLAMPMRPGDVILVPGAGEVLIEGWVPKPGAYPANAGLTVLGAVAVAGGPMFAADTSAVRIVRTQANGKKSLFVANLQDIKEGIQEDIHVQDGDIIEVTGSTAKMVPYGVYQFFTSVFRVGGSLPLTGF
jgi:polysaccharide export outer membrane protein